MLSHLDLQIASLLLSFHKLGNGGSGNEAIFQGSNAVQWVSHDLDPEGDHPRHCHFTFATSPQRQTKIMK